jgi:hypothetical protein
MSNTHNPNPYASPRADQQLPEALPSRAQAQAYVRRTLLILLLPIAVNIWAMYFWNSGTVEMPDGLRRTLIAANVLWFSFLFTICWVWALWLIELLARGLRLLLGGGVSREDWLASLHQSLWPMVPAAAIGGVLWIFWLCLFFLAGRPGGFALDVVFQIAGHALGAWVYGNVFWHWYLLRREQTTVAAA